MAANTSTFWTRGDLSAPLLVTSSIRSHAILCSVRFYERYSPPLPRVSQSCICSFPVEVKRVWLARRSLLGSDSWRSSSSPSSSSPSSSTSWQERFSQHSLSSVSLISRTDFAGLGITRRSKFLRNKFLQQKFTAGKIFGLAGKGHSGKWPKEDSNADTDGPENGSSRRINGLPFKKTGKRKWSSDNYDSQSDSEDVLESIFVQSSIKKHKKQEQPVSLGKIFCVFGVVVLSLAAAFAQRKAKNHLSNHVLPPLVAMASEQTGREIVIGEVLRLSPLGITLGPSSLGPESEEFSCGEVQEVEVKIRPIASLRRGQLVLDAVVSKPRVLVSQLPDWTWLEIPAEMDDHVKRTSNDPGLDERTKIRRKARELALVELANERTQVARLGAERRYKMKTGEVLRGPNDLRKQMGLMGNVKVLDNKNGEERVAMDRSSTEMEIETETETEVDGEVDREGGWNGEDDVRGGYQRLMKAGQKWVTGKVWEPSVGKMKAVLSKVQAQKTESSKEKVVERLLDQSSAAVLSHFAKLDEEHRQFLDNFNDCGDNEINYGSVKSGGNVLNGDSSWKGQSQKGGSSTSLAPMKVTVSERTFQREKFGERDAQLSEGYDREDETLEGRGLARQVKEGEGTGSGQGRSGSGTNGSLSTFGEGGEMGSEPASIESIRDALACAIQKRTKESLNEHRQGGTQYIGEGRDNEWNGKMARGKGPERNTSAFGVKGGRERSSQMGSNSEGQQMRNRVGSMGEIADGRKGERGRERHPLDAAAAWERGKEKGLRVANDWLSRQAEFQGISMSPFEKEKEAETREVISKRTDSPGNFREDQLPGSKSSISRGSRSPEVSILSSTGGIISDSINSSVVNLKGNSLSSNSNAATDTASSVSATQEGGLSRSASVRNEGQQNGVEGNDSFSLEKHGSGSLSIQGGGKKGKGSSKTSKSLKGKKSESWSPVALDRVFIKEGTLVLVGYGDIEPRFVEAANGWVKLSNNYRSCQVAFKGNLKEWRTGNPDGDGGRLSIKVDSDLDKKSWAVSIRGRNLFAPLFERLLEIPIDWYKGKADGDLLLWMNAEDTFPHLKGRVDVQDLDFQIWESPSPFMGVNGSLLFEGQRMFFHDATGKYGHVPLSVSGDMDLNPVNGEYRLSAQVAPVEVNALMDTVGAKPPPYPLAGAVKGVLYCRGQLDIPIFEGTVEISNNHVPLALSAPPSDATRAIEIAAERGAVAAYDKVPFSSASANFTFRTDDCMADVFGIRVVPVGGGEIRGAGDLWICPEGEEDPNSVNVDCWAFGIPAETLLQWYAPTGFEIPTGSIGATHGEVKVRGALLMPTIDVSWKAPDAKGSLEGAHGKIAISRESMSVNSSAVTFDLSAKVDTSYPPLPPRPTRNERKLARFLGSSSTSGRPTVEGLDLDLHLKGFDLLGLAPHDSKMRSENPAPVHVKVAGKVKLSGRVSKSGTQELVLKSRKDLKGQVSELGKFLWKEGGGGGGLKARGGGRLEGGRDRNTKGGGVVARGSRSNRQPSIEEKNVTSQKNEGGSPSKGFPGLVGEIFMQGLKINQLLVGSNLQGSFQVSEKGFGLETHGKPDEHLVVQMATCEENGIGGRGMGVGGGVGLGEVGGMLSLQKGFLRTEVQFQPGVAANVEVRNLPLDELELASLRGEVEKVDVSLDFSKRRGSGSLLMMRPRFSGLHSESLEANFRWTGDVISLERSVLEQANSRYVLEGEYVLPGVRDRAALKDKQEEDRLLGKAMAGQLRSMMSSMGRWRLKLDVPRAEIAEMLPAARLLSRNRDPAVVFRSKEMFVNGVQKVGFVTNSLNQQLEYLRHRKPVMEATETELGTVEPSETSEATSLPGLAELRGRWHGTVSASGGGNGDTKADFDLQGHDWEWGEYSMQEVEVSGDYSNHQGLRLEKLFIRHNTATLHMEGTPLGPSPNLHFAVLHFPANLIPPVLQAMQSESSPMDGVVVEDRPPQAPVKGIIFVEGDYKGRWPKPQCEVTAQLLDGAIGGVSLERAEVAASITSSSRLAFHAYLKPADVGGQVRVKGSIPFSLTEEVEEPEVESWGERREERAARAREKESEWEREKERERERESERDGEDGERRDERREAREGVKLLLESARALDHGDLGKGAVEIDAAVKDGGMRLLTALSPGLQWLQGSADVTAQVRGTFYSPDITGVATFNRVAISSPVLSRPLSSLGGTIRVRDNCLHVEELEGKLGRRGVLVVRGQLPLKPREDFSMGDGITIKADAMEVRARNVFSGQVDSQIVVLGSLKEPEVTGLISLSRGNVYLSQEKAPTTEASVTSIGSDNWNTSQGSQAEEIEETGELEVVEDGPSQVPVAVRLRGLKLHLGPELRIVYPLILNFATSGELELNGCADPRQVRPRGTLAFESGDVNLVATQVRLNRDHPNRVKFEPEQGLDPTLDLKLVGNDFQLRIQGRATKWQDNVVITGTGKEESLSSHEAAEKFEAKLKESVLEADGQLAFRKLAAATVETLMPKIETQGEFGQARWRLVSAPQIPNLLSLDPTTDPFKSLANLSLGTEVEIQFGKKVQASVVRQLKDSEMATQWTLLYQLNNKLRVLYSFVPSVSPYRLFFEAHTDHEWGPEHLIESSQKVVKKVWNGYLR